MPKKKKYENTEIVKEILSREFNHAGDIKTTMIYKFLDFKKKEDREFIKQDIKALKEIFEDALKELEV